MKTPRELLLEKHRAAIPALDALRRNALVQISRPQSNQVKSAPFGLKLWAELITPYRRIWSGLAGAWVVIVGLQLASADHSPSSMADVGPISAETRMAAQQQQREFAQLLDLTPREPAEPPRQHPQPRSQLRTTTLVG